MSARILAISGQRVQISANLAIECIVSSPAGGLIPARFIEA